MNGPEPVSRGVLAWVVFAVLVFLGILVIAATAATSR